VAPPRQARRRAQWDLFGLLPQLDELREEAKRVTKPAARLGKAATGYPPGGCGPFMNDAG